MTNIELKVALRALEARISVLEASRRQDVESAVAAVLAARKQPEKPSGRGMCPKCGVKPNYFMHVKNCKGDKNNKNADDRRGNPVSSG